MGKENLGYYFDENLKEVFEEPIEAREYIQKQKLLLKTQPVDERVKMLAEIGTYSRILRDLDDARAYLEQALQEFPKSTIKGDYYIVLRIRYAHVLQWQEHFNKSTSILKACVKECESIDELYHYLDYAWQHLGKNYFDMKQYASALRAFNIALELRNKKGDIDLIHSTKAAINESNKRIQNS